MSFERVAVVAAWPRFWTPQDRCERKMSHSWRPSRKSLAWTEQPPVASLSRLRIETCRTTWLLSLQSLRHVCFIISTKITFREKQNKACWWNFSFYRKKRAYATRPVSRSSYCLRFNEERWCNIWFRSNSSGLPCFFLYIIYLFNKVKIKASKNKQKAWRDVEHDVVWCAYVYSFLFSIECRHKCRDCSPN